MLEQWEISRRNSQASSMLCSYENQVETSLSICGHTCTHSGIGGRRKEKTERLWKWGKFSICVMVDGEIFTWKIKKANYSS